MASVAATLFSLRSPSLYESASKIQILTLTLRPKCWSIPSSIVSLVRNCSVIFFLSLFFWIRLDRWNNRISKFLFSYTFSSRSRARVRCDWFLSRRVNQEEKRERKRENRNVSFPRVNPISASLGTICSNGRRRSTFANDWIQIMGIAISGERVVRGNPVSHRVTNRILFSFTRYISLRRWDTTRDSPRSRIPRVLPNNKVWLNSNFKSYWEFLAGTRTSCHFLPLLSLFPKRVRRFLSNQFRCLPKDNFRLNRLLLPLILKPVLFVFRRELEKKVVLFFPSFTYFSLFSFSLRSSNFVARWKII